MGPKGADFRLVALALAEAAPATAPATTDGCCRKGQKKRLYIRAGADTSKTQGGGGDLVSRY